MHTLAQSGDYTWTIHSRRGFPDSIGFLELLNGVQPPLFHTLHKALRFGRKGVKLLLVLVFNPVGLGQWVMSQPKHFGGVGASVVLNGTES